MKKIIGIVLMVMSIYACSKDEETPISCDVENVSFSTDVFPILQANCTFSICHSSSGQANGIDLSSYDRLKATVTQNTLLGAINHSPGFEPMPKNAAKLPDCDIETITVWYKEGALDN